MLQANEESNEEFWEVLRAFLYPAGLPPGLPPKVGESTVAPKTSQSISEMSLIPSILARVCLYSKVDPNPSWQFPSLVCHQCVCHQIT